MTRMALPAILVVAGLIIAIWISGNKQAANVPVVASPVSTAPAAGAETVPEVQSVAAPSPSQFRWVGDGPASYRLSYDVSIETGAKVQHTAINCKLVVRVIEKSPGSLVLSVQFRDTEVLGAIAGAHTAAMYDQAIMAITFAADGHLQSMRLPDTVPAEDAQMLSNTFYALQVVLDRDSPVSWEATETDANGQSRWAYTRNGEVIRKRRLSLSPAPGNPLQTSIESSDVTARLGEFWLTSLEGAEVTKLALPDFGLAYKATTKWGLRKIDGTVNHADLKMLSAAEVRQWTPADAPERKDTASAYQVDELEVRRKLYAFLTAATAVADLAEAMRLRPFPDDSPESKSALTQMLKAYPERAADILPILKNGSLNSGVTAVVLNALELSGAVADGPQLALASILSHPADYSSDVVFQAAVAAGGVGKLSGPELQDALLEIQHNSPDRNLADAAEKALGTLSASNEPLREMLTPGIVEMLSSPSSSPGELANTLWTAANGKITGGGVYTQAQSLLTHPDDTVRGAALDYFAATAGDASALALPLLSDSSASVQQAAIKAALASPSPPKEALDAVAKLVTDRSGQPGTRIVGIQRLANIVTANPWLKNTFQQVLRDNPPEEVREVALNALTPRKAGNPFPALGHPTTVGTP